MRTILTASFLAAILFVAVAANMSSGPLSHGGPFYHFIAFFTLGLLARLGIYRAGFFTLTILLIGLGCAIELSQETVGGQHAAEWSDVLVNAIGSVMGILVGAAILKLFTLLRPKQDE